MSIHTKLRCALLVIAAIPYSAVALAGVATITAGYNLSLDPTIINIPSITPGQTYQVSQPLEFDPAAGPMIKNFGTPRSETGAPLILVGSQPIVFPISEEFPLVGPDRINPSVKDWHEVIITPGWTWVLLTDQSLITRNGQPWPSTSQSNDPTRIDVVFEEILVGNTLDVHKGLLWIGATGPADIWGDDPTETTISVIEYPTPEPTSILLALVGLVALVSARRFARRAS